MGWRANIATLGGRPRRRALAAPAPISIHLGNPWLTIQAVLDSTVKSAFQAATAMSTAQAIVALKTQFASAVQAQITQIQTAGGDASGVTAALNTLRASGYPATTQGGLQTVALASLVYVKLQDAVYRGLVASGAASATNPAANITSPPWAMSIAQYILAFALASGGCAGLSSVPAALEAFQRAATWLSSGWMTASVSGIYDTDTAAIAQQLNPSAPAACTSSAPSGGQTWANIQTMLDGQAGDAIAQASNVYKTSPQAAVATIREAAAYAGTALGQASALATPPAALGAMIATLSSLPNPTSATTVADALKATVSAVGMYVAFQQFIFSNYGPTLTTPPLALPLAAGALYMALSQSDGCANPNVPTAVAAFQQAYKWMHPSFVASGAYDAATQTVLASMTSVTVPAPCPAVSTAPGTPGAPGATNPPPTGAVTSPAPSTSTVTTPAPTSTTAPATAASSNTGLYVAGGILLLIGAAVVATKLTHK